MNWKFVVLFLMGFFAGFFLMFTVAWCVFGVLG